MKLNNYIDYTNLNAYTTTEDIRFLCERAKKYDVASVCIHPCNIRFAKEQLEDTNIKVCTVIGFPLGQNTTEMKVFETKDAINRGAEEIDMVINIGRLKEKEYLYVEEEIRKIKEVTDPYLLKVIIETCYLDEEEIIFMTEMCSKLNVDYIKTSTGFGSSGAKTEHIQLIKQHKNDDLKIKAAGGIRDQETAFHMIEAGADRLGISKLEQILKERK